MNRKTLLLPVLLVGASVSCFAATPGAGPAPGLATSRRSRRPTGIRPRRALLERAGFGGTPEEIKVLAAMTPQKRCRPGAISGSERR